MRHVLGAVLAAMALALTGCGGGGGSSSAPDPTPAPSPAPAPTPQSAGVFVQPSTYVATPTPTAMVATIRTTMSSATSVGTSTNIPVFNPSTGNLTLPNVTVNGTMYGATVMHSNGDGSFTVTQQPTADTTDTITASSYVTGNLTLKSVMVGTHRYTNAVLHLDTSGNFILVDGNDPIVVQASSYANRVSAAAAIGPQNLPGEVLMGNAVAFGDFFQDGTYSMVTHTLVYDPSNSATYTDYGTIHFYKNVNGTWVDHTSDILTNNVGCLQPRKAIVARFVSNGTGQPDIYFGCTGPDVNVNTLAANQRGEPPHMLVAQVDGTYKNVTLPFNCYCHGVSAADFNNNGADDILISDTEGPTQRPYFLKNDGTGNFTQDFSRLSVTNGPMTNGMIWPASIFTVELIDFYNRGLYDAFLAGAEPIPNSTGAISGNWPTSIFKNDGTGNYPPANQVIVPTDNTNDMVLDIAIMGGKLYLDRTSDGDPTHDYMTGAIQRVDFATMTNEGDLYQHSGQYNIQPSPWINWINWIEVYNGNVVAMNSNISVSVK